ncbi:outer membrane beta-barrel protein [Microbulbifer taiwanensis]|uniref:Outer membrane beta-barrel protein n=1 Tax=Microbulbifer taiwanensis TaxID=986746 RepID=A0ABW1YK54_9GAMM|nr:outer membrane beta-barrel protein [Microbulbifer taiwanensis]
MNRPHFLLAVPLLTTCVQAQADFYSHKYGGIAYSDMQLQDFCSGAAEFVQSLNLPQQTASSSGCGERGDGWKIYGGWRWTPHLAVEASYHQLASAELDFRIDADNGEYLQFEDEIETQLINAFVIGHWPLAEGLSLFGKLGGGAWNSELSERQTGELFFVYQIGEEAFEERLTEVSGKATEVHNGFHWGYGFGLSYRYRNSWTLRAEWESFSEVGSEDFRGGFDVEAASLGWSMHF